MVSQIVSLIEEELTYPFSFWTNYIGGGTCLNVGGPRKKVTEMHVQVRAGNDCKYSQYCLMFLFN